MKKPVEYVMVRLSPAQKAEVKEAVRMLGIPASQFGRIAISRLLEAVRRGDPIEIRAADQPGQGE